MQEVGWIKIHRKILDWEWYDDPTVFRVFMHCLFKANHTDKKWRGKVIKRGQFLTGRKVFAEEVHLEPSAIYRAWKKLESTGELNIKANSKGTVITVCNYNSYQEKETKSEQQSEQQVNNKRTASEQQVNTTKNEKNVKNEKNSTHNTGARGLDLPHKNFPDEATFIEAGLADFRSLGFEKEFLQEVYAKRMAMMQDGQWVNGSGEPIDNWKWWLKGLKSYSDDWKQRNTQTHNKRNGKAKQPGNPEQISRFVDSIFE